MQNSGPITTTLLSYAATLFAFSPYFPRLPQIEMLVNVKFSAEIPAETMEVLDPSETQPEDGDMGEDGAGYVFLLNCRTFEIWTYDPAASPSSTQPVPNTIEELIALVGAASFPPIVLLAPLPPQHPHVQTNPDPPGESALSRILARDPTVIPLLKSDFLGYAPRPTQRTEELFSADTAEAAHKERWRKAIERVRGYVSEMEWELRAGRRWGFEGRREEEGEGVEGMEGERDAVDRVEGEREGSGSGCMRRRRRSSWSGSWERAEAYGDGDDGAKSR